MAWIPKMLRGQRVLARAHDDGRLLAEGGRVEVRYKPNDGRAYRAAERNLEAIAGAEVLPDDHCGPAGEPPKKEEKPKEKKSDAAAKAARVEQHHAAAAKSTAEVIVFADGACSGNPGPAGLGVAIFEGAVKKKELSEFLGIGTNNIAELTAILRAAEVLVDDPRAIEIRTDSSYAIGVLTKGWKAKANPELVAKTKQALAKLASVRLTYVPGHAGVAGNELADALAVAAVQARKSSGWIDSP
ncbi:MAG: RNase H family protein [Sandaracinus sp.]